MAKQPNYYGKRKKIALVETSAPPELSVVLEKIPDDLKWKFTSNHDSGAAQRYWLKLTDETCDEKHEPSLGLKAREICHQENLDQLKKQLEILLKTCFKKRSKYKLWCEARFGKVDWRASEDDLRRNLTVKDISKLRNREFYTRTTTKTKEMIDKFQLRSFPIDEPIDTVVLTVEDTTASKEKEVRYKISLDEYQEGKFSFNSHVACEQHTVNLERFDADFICVGRSYDVRISSACKFEQSMPPDVIESIEEICKSIQRIDGKLRMILKHGSIKVKFVRQMRTWSFTLEDEKHDVNFYELKETNTDQLPEDKVVELEHNENQEIEVKLIREVNNSEEMIREILTEVEKLVTFSMDVVDMAEECKDPATPH